MNTAGTYLYVVSGTTTATLTEYALSSGAIGSATAQVALQVPGFTTDAMVPTGVTVLANNNVVQGNAVYATVYDQSAYNPGGTTTSTAHPGWVFGFAIGSGGALSPADEMCIRDSHRLCAVLELHPHCERNARHR